MLATGGTGQPTGRLITGSFGTRVDEESSTLNRVEDFEESSITVLKVQNSPNDTVSLTRSIEIYQQRFKQVSDLA
jgi:hypothetical protein